jgi:teichoic acid transport system permease protein
VALRPGRFGLLLDVSGRGENFLLFLTIGLFVFQYTQRAAMQGAQSIVINLGLIKAIRFPRSILPASSTLTETLASIPTFLIMFVLALGVGEAVSVRWLLFPLLLGVQAVFSLGVAMIAARLTTHFLDTVQVLPFVFRLLMYGSGVMFSLRAYIPDNGVLQLLAAMNPLYCFIELARWCVFGSGFQPEYVVSVTVWTFATVVVGFFWFRSGEEGFARD